MARSEPPKPNKAHTATANRVARRYGGEFNRGKGPDVETDEMVVYVVNSATVRPILRQIQPNSRPVYLAVTNQEALVETLRAVQGTDVGVLSPQGDVVRQPGAT